MRFNLKSIWKFLLGTVQSWSNDNASILAAALSYYTFFSLAPLLTIIISITGLFFGEQAVQSSLMAQITSLVGSTGATAIENLIIRSEQPAVGVAAAVISFGTLLIGAVAVFIQLQAALNIIWHVPPLQRGVGIRGFIRQYLLSFGIVISAAFLLLVSLVVSAALISVNKYLAGFVPGIDVFWRFVDLLTSFGIITVLFALIFKFLPNARIAWRDVWIGATVTALLFTVGKYLIGLYLGKSNLAGTYGGAASLVIILLWVYYSSQILLAGAEFTKEYAYHYGSLRKP